MTKPSRGLHSILQITFFGILLAAVLVISTRRDAFEQSPRRIEIGDAELAHVIASWQQTWQRLPSTDEIETVLSSYVRDEVLYREAMMQNLDENNSMVKRALINQMNMIAESQAETFDISDADIEAYYSLRKDRFRTDTAFTFTQIYFSSDSRGQAAKSDAELVIKQLNESMVDVHEASERGDAIMIESTMANLTQDQIARQLGDNFASEVKGLEIGVWSGPVESAFGWHAVYLAAMSPGQPLPFQQVREEIIRELQYEQRQAAKELFYTEVMQQYDIVYKGEVKALINGK